MVLVLTLASAFHVGADSAVRGRGAQRALILYDSAGDFGWIGGLHSRMLANLLGHFRLRWQIKPVEDYKAGDLNRADVSFYLGNVWNNPLPAEFLSDAAQTKAPLCWLKYNLWQLASTLGTNFESRHGFRFDFMDATGFPAVQYRGETFSKNQLDRELGRTTLLNPALANARATACSADGASCVPYAVRGGNLWYIADSPFSFVSESDRYLVFADLLHEILGVEPPQRRRALIRIEDIDATTPPAKLREIADFLNAEGVPFLLSVVPVHHDPLGVYNGGVPRTIRLSQSAPFVEALRYATAKGGQVLIHGYTHQYANVLNPLTAASGDDYEFFRVTLNDDGSFRDFKPLPEDSRRFVIPRLVAARQEFWRAGLRPVAWETPHYAASPLDSRLFAQLFGLTMHRVLYFDDAGRVLGRPHGGRRWDWDDSDDDQADSGTHLTGQFFPYVIHRDIYGQKIVPENLGNIEPAAGVNYPVTLPADLIRHAKKNSVLRDAWASAFYHPYLDLSYLQELVRGIKALGFTYVPIGRDID